MTTTTDKGFTYGWNPGDSGWGAANNVNIRLSDAYGVDQWATDLGTTSGLLYGYRGGVIVSASGVISTASSGTLTVADNDVSYVERTHAGVVSSNTTGFTTGRLPMAEVTTASGAITDIVDRRVMPTQVPGVSVAAIPFMIDGGGSAITTGIKGDIEIPFAGTITGWTLVADQPGDIVIDTWKDTYANYPPDVADTMWGTKPALSTASKAQATGLSIAVTAGDIIRFNVDSAATVERVTLSFTITKS